MADLKTTAEERARLAGWSHMADAIFAPGTRAALMGCLDDVDTLLAENAKLRAVAEDGRELLRMVSMTYYDPPACGVVAGINIGEIREFLAATDPPVVALAALEAP